MPPAGYVPIDLHRPISLFADGDPTHERGTLLDCVTLIAKEECRVRPERGERLPIPSMRCAPHSPLSAQPLTAVSYRRSLFSVRRAGMECPVSQGFAGHLFLFHIYDPSAFDAVTFEPFLSRAALTRRRRRAGIALFKALHLLPYLFVVVPLRIVKPWLSKELPLDLRRRPDKATSAASLQLNGGPKPYASSKTWDVRVVEATNRAVWSMSAVLERWIFSPLFGSGWTVAS